MVNMAGNLQCPVTVPANVVINCTDEDIKHRRVKFAMMQIFERGQIDQVTVQGSKKE